MKKLHLILIILFISLQASLAQSENGKTIKAEQEITNQKVKVFPNPATNVVNILGLQNSMRADIIVSDTYGNIVLNHRWEIKNQALNLPISNLDSGIYMISIRSENQHVKTKFFKK